MMIRAALVWLDLALVRVFRWSVNGCFLGLFLLLSLGIIQRTVPFLKLSGYDELIELLFVWMTFVGSVALWREGTLYRVEIIDNMLGARARRVLAIVIQFVMLVLAVMLAVKGGNFMLVAGETTPFLRLDKAYWHAAIPVCGAIMTVYSAIALWRALRGREQDTSHEFITLG